MTFAHLHVHSKYSLLDGSIKIEELIEQCKNLGMNSIALTDHGNMFGVIEFYKEAVKWGIKPIVGCEVYVCEDRLKKDSNHQYWHLILLCENEKGYKNLVKIVSDANINGYYYKPRTDFNFLKEHSEGLIALSACLGGEVQRKILENNVAGAEYAAQRYMEIFGENDFFIELQDHGIMEEKNVINKQLKIAENLGIGLVATNDVHYLRKEDAKAHDILLCIQTGKLQSDNDRMKFPCDEFYLKSPEQMQEIFSYIPQALDNTIKIAQRCDLEIRFNEQHLPDFQIKENMSHSDYLYKLCIDGLKNRYGEIDDDKMKRFEMEFNTIKSMGYIDYFLVVRDFVNFAKENNIPVGPGRGSGPASIVSYALGIVDVDPLKYGLIFERFLNKERVTMPDIDIDFCQERRGEVIDYVINKYGSDKVSLITTFGTLGARQVIRDVARVKNVDLKKADKLAKAVPRVVNADIKSALEQSPDLKLMYNEDEECKDIIDTALKLEGLPRQTGTHAAGVLITKDPITDFIPLVRNKEAIATQFNMVELEELGFLKIDFLGLRNLTVIHDACDLVYKNYGIRIDFENMEYDDPEVLDIFKKGETLGIFQFESPGMRIFLKELQAEKFEDLIAANSLFRPGPMQFIEQFIESRHDKSKIKYIDPALKPILEETYGCIVYQEQVMRIFRDLAGYTLGGADIVRRAMGKKKLKVLQEERKNFIYGKDENDEIIIKGAVRNGISVDNASKIFDCMIDFAKYAFNKSHSAAYSVVAYRTAYIKRYYPLEFMASLISSVMNDKTEVIKYIEECKRMGIDLLNPSVNFSYKKFTPENGKIRFGLQAVKNVGGALIDAIIKAREDGKFKDIYDFINRSYRKDPQAMNKKAVESLIKAGALDDLEIYRSRAMAVYEIFIDSISKEFKNNHAAQISLFSIEDRNNTPIKIPDIAEFSKKILLDGEKEVTGMYISGHPMEEYKKELELNSTFNSAELIEKNSEEIYDKNFKDSMTVMYSGMILNFTKKYTKNNDLMAFLSVEDLYGQIEVIVFPKVYKVCSSLLEEDRAVKIKGSLKLSDTGEPKIIAEIISPLEKLSKKVYIRVRKGINKELVIKKILDLSDKYEGKNPIHIYFEESSGSIESRNKKVDAENEEFLKELYDIFSKEDVVIK